MPVDTTITLIGTYQPGLVALSILVAAIASYTSLELAHRVTESRGPIRWAWQAGGAVAMGVGIWSMHFIGMLAFTLPVVVTYDPLLTGLSLLIAMAAAAVALTMVNRAVANWRSLLLGGTLIGLGIASMHYTGMAALSQSVCMRYDPLLFTASVIIAVWVAWVALWLMYRIRPRIHRHVALFQVGTALVMGGAISGMHYTGMAAVIFEPLSTATNAAAQGLDVEGLSVAVSVAALIILGGTLLTALVDDALILRMLRGRGFWARYWILLAAGLFGLSYWLVEALFHSVILGQESFAEALQPHDKNELWMRTLIILTAAGFGLFGYRLYTIAGRLMREVEQARDSLESTVEARTRELSESERRMHGILDTTHDAFVATNSKGRIIDWNPAAVALFGWERFDVIGQSVDDRLFSLSPGTFLKLAKNEKLNCVHEMAAIKRDGTTFPVELSVSVLPLGSGVVFNAFIRDISARKRAENELQHARQVAEQGNRMKSEFLANMSHELRTPLNAILGFSEVLKDGVVGPLAPLQQDYVGEVFVSAQHLLSLINDILDLSKIEAGKMQLELALVDVPHVLSSSLTIVRERAMAHRIALTLEVAEEVGRAEMDERKLKQILFNLLSNAVKFTPDGGRVTLHAARSDEWLAISVSDTGIGMAPEDQARLFQPFEQLDGSMTRKYEGTGLGLSLVKRLVELHGGRVSVESVVGAGSRFTVELPCQLVGVKAAVPVRQGEQIALGEQAARRPGSDAILLVEDNEHAAALLMAQLKSAGYRTLWARNGEEGLDIAQDLHPRLILLDIMLPGMDGWAALARLKSQPDLVDIPVMVVSIVADEAKGLALGAVEVIEKPVRRELLLRKVERIFGKVGDNKRNAVTILAIDDDPNARELVRNQLASSGWKVETASSGREGLERLRARKPALVILDLMMPEMSGFEVLASIRGEPATVDLPVIITTAKVLSEDEQAWLRAQSVVVVGKTGVEERQLAAQVQMVIDGLYAKNHDE